MSLLDVNSHRTQLVLTAVGTAAVTASIISLYNTTTRRRKRRELNDEIRRSLANSLALSASAHTPPVPHEGRRRGSDVGEQEVWLGGPEPGEGEGSEYGYDEELVREQLARNYAFFGDEGMKKVRAGSVVVVGCGGVGSWAAVMLARTGVSKIRLVDFDYVTLSSLNRHATATLADVGTPKVHCVARTLRQVARFVEVDARVELWRAQDGATLLEGADWVIDAIDNIQTKVELLKHCVENDIKIFSSMGAGTKSDPTRIQIADISDTVYDPLARAVRLSLRASGIREGVPVVYSTEVPGDVTLLPLSEEQFAQGKVEELAAMDDFRVRILPVFGPLPAIFGLHAATYIICELAGKPLERPLPVKHRKKLYDRLLKDLLTRESRIAGRPINKLPLSIQDVGLLFEDISLARSIVPPHATCARAALARWDPLRPLSIENLVVLEEKEAEKHMREVFGMPAGEKASYEEGEREDEEEEEAGEGEVVDALGRKTRKVRTIKRPQDVWGAEVVKAVERRLEEAVKFRKWAL
ncbi:hypothetical protein EW146_g8853 [Bondarzewia mesenterica]|uniref:THIF-type NAD/FAD binding fold domain-containing protein n=1 Tax=Bondarzewia mesenterica TaxID=1095465 RepID=A0A4S4LAY8_9AGAM|nr:hypothetical protein EW146_g8853 [Bondarzewia mesenterica]